MVTVIIKTVNIKGNPVKFQNPDSDITNATIKDAPIELTDDTVIAALSNFGHIVPQSMRRGKIRGTNILTGTRYVQINDVVNTIPTEMGGGSRVVVSTAAFRAGVRGLVPGLGGLKETKNCFFPIHV